MEKSIWLSYDLGVQGDYTGLYAWLDNLEAKECGNNVALFKYEIDDEEDLREKIKADLSEHVTLEKHDRIYILFSDSETKKRKGCFLFGKRKASPWKGYGDGEDEIDEEE
jgi:hypothetical protein